MALKRSGFESRAYTRTKNIFSLWSPRCIRGDLVDNTVLKSLNFIALFVRLLLFLNWSLSVSLTTAHFVDKPEQLWEKFLAIQWLTKISVCTAQIVEWLYRNKFVFHIGNPVTVCSLHMVLKKYGHASFLLVETRFGIQRFSTPVGVSCSSFSKSSNAVWSII